MFRRATPSASLLLPRAGGINRTEMEPIHHSLQPTCCGKRDIINACPLIILVTGPKLFVENQKRPDVLSGQESRYEKTEYAPDESLEPDLGFHLFRLPGDHLHRCCSATAGGGHVKW